MIKVCLVVTVIASAFEFFQIRILKEMNERLEEDLEKSSNLCKYYKLESKNWFNKYKSVKDVSEKEK